MERSSRRRRWSPWPDRPPVCLAPCSWRSRRLAGKAHSNTESGLDSPHAIGFYVSSALSVGGGIAVAFLGTRTRRALALLVAGVGVAGVDASLSAGFAAAVVLVSFAACAALLARPDLKA